MKKAFTLLEMTVVLAVIALVTHFAVRELGQYRDMKLEKAADRQLEEIRDASKRFLADIGRLPRLQPGTNDAGEVVWTLSELWKKPAGLVFRRVAGKDGVAVAVGWKGPYLRLPFGRDRLLDPWGNPVELEDDAGLRRLWTDGRMTVTNVCHYGPSGQEFARKNMALGPDGGMESDLVITVDTGAYAGLVECSWYGAYENTVTNSAVSSASAGGQFVFRKVPCGPKRVKIVTGRTVVRSVEVSGPVTEAELKVE